jgi:hypothetical protein
MEYLLVYRCVDGGYLFCPDCVQASIEAAQTYGPLRLLGRVDRGELDGLADRIIDQQVSSHLYAHIPPEQVGALQLDLDPKPVEIATVR